MSEEEKKVTKAKKRSAILLIVMSVIGVGLGYTSSIVAARLPGSEAFPEYAVVVAAMGLLCAIAEAGVGKYSLKALPAYAASKQWSLAAGYWRLSVRTVLIVSTSLAICVFVAEGISGNRFADDPLSVAVFFLPAAAVCGVGIDLVMANRAALTGMFIARVLLPLTTLFLLLAVNHFVTHFTATIAIVCYGAGSVAGAIYCTTAFLWSSPRQLLTTKPNYHRKEWLPQCVYFAAFGFLATRKCQTWSGILIHHRPSHFSHHVNRDKVHARFEIE